VGTNTSIAWTDHSWNPWTGCHKVSPGCGECYMHREKKRYGQDPSTVVRSKPPTFNAPRKWKDPARVFVCSWSDFFIEEADPWRAEAWEIIRSSPHLTFQIPTKRAHRIAACLPDGWPLPNVWLGVSVENQEAADTRIPDLLSVKAAVRFVSAEPLLGPVTLSPDAMMGLDWLIVGGESGPRCRPMEIEWMRDLQAQAAHARICFFAKQLGGFPDKRDRMEDFPEDLRVREFPKESANG